jgi:proline iminopeptidase
MTLSLYRDISPANSGFLQRPGGHEIYFEICGQDDAIPAVFLHGGPGAPPRWAHRQIFDQDLYRTVFYHQRGCGMSRPHLSLENNTIDAQVEDICALKDFLGIKEPWIVVGNSWGTALAQIYAVRHPEQVRHLVLAAVSFADREDAKAFLEEGYASRFFPDRFAYYRDRIPEGEREEGLAEAYYKVLNCGDREKELEAVKSWALWNFSLLVMNMETKAMEKARRRPDAFEPLAKLFFHYYRNEYSKGDRAHIWPYLDVLRKLPVTIAHGRYDLICPPENAWELHRELPQSKLHFIADSGHFSLESTFSRALIDIMDEIGLSGR